MRPRARSDRDEGGAILPMTAGIVVIVLLIAAFAVDIGLQRVAVRDMQALADAAAMDAARTLPTCNNTALTEVANRTKDRHGTVIGDDEALQAVAGHVDPTTGRFVAGARNGSCDAVQVTSATSVVQAFAGGRGQAARSAVGTRGSPEVCFSVGTRTLTLQTEDSPNPALGGVLDAIFRYNFDIAGYEGLVVLRKVQLPLLGLATELGVGTAEELLTLPDLSLGELMLATANVLRRDGHPAEANVLRMVGVRVMNFDVVLGDILDIGTGGGTGLAADLNTLDLIGAAVVAANGTNAIRVDDLRIDLPGDLADAEASLVITEPPQIACGTVGATARTAQVRLDLKTRAQADSVASVDLSLGVQVGIGEATLAALTCDQGNGGVTSVTMNPVTTAAAEVVGYQGSGPATAKIAILKAQYGTLLGPVVALLLAPLASIVLDVGLAATVGAGGPYDRYTSYPHTGLPPTQLFGGGRVLRLSSTSVQFAPESGLVIDLLGGLLNNVLSTLTNRVVTPVVNNVLGPALDGVLVPVLRLLGIQLGITEVTMLGRPSCQSVKVLDLVGE